MDLTEAQQIIERVVENEAGSASITDRELAIACATVLVRNELLAPRTDSDG